MAFQRDRLISAYQWVNIVKFLRDRENEFPMFNLGNIFTKNNRRGGIYKMKIVKNIFLFIILLTFLFGCANEKKVLIYSIPGNLKVYLAPLDTDKTDLDKIGGSYVPIYNKSSKKHYLIDDKNFKGTSPLVLNNIKAGDYIVAVEPVEFLNKNMSFQNFDPFLKPIAMVSSFSMEGSEWIDKLKSGKIKQEGAIIYMFKKKKEKKEIVIIYAKKNFTLDELNSEYPKDLNFAFDKLKLAQELEEKNIKDMITDNELEMTLDLLQRGGKALVQKGDIRFLIEILNDQKFKIETQGKIK